MNYFSQETERIYFRKLDESDIETWSEFFENNDRLEYLGIPDLTKNKYELSKEWIMIQLERYKTSGLGHIAAIEKSTGNFIGLGGIIPRVILDKNEYEIAYSLKPEFWKKGFGTEIATQLKKFGLENSISNRFISIIDIRNTDSINVAKKNEMSVIHEMEYLGMNVFVFGTSI